MSKLAEFHKLMAASGYSFQIGYMSIKEPTDEEIFYSIRKAVLEVEGCEQCKKVAELIEGKLAELPQEEVEKLIALVGKENHVHLSLENKKAGE